MKMMKNPSKPRYYIILFDTIIVLSWQYYNSILVGLPVYLVRRFLSVHNASARMFFKLRCSDHITDVLASSHWLSVPEHIQFMIAVLAYNKVLHGTAQHYFGLHVVCHVSYLPGRRCIRLASTDRLVKLSTIGNRTFKVAAMLLKHGTVCRKT